jgi:hypothetical protein
MMTKILYPYRQLPEPNCTVELLDGPINEELIDNDRREIDLRSIVGSQPGTIDFSASVELQRVPSRARDDAPAVSGIALVLGCGQTDFRQSTLLRRSPLDALIWTGDVSLDTRNVRGTVTARAIVAGTVSGMPDRILASSRPWTLLVDEFQQHLQNGLIPIRWVDFADPSYPQLHDFRDDLIYLDMGGAIPELLLNSRQMELRQVLPRAGRPLGPIGALYDPVRTGIARTTWQALLQASLAGIAEPASDGELPDWPAVPWQAEVLRSVLPRVYQTDRDEALRLAWIASRSADEARGLVERSVPVVGHDIVRDGQAVRNGVRILERFSQESE